MKPYELEDKTATVQYIIENSSAFAWFATMNKKKPNRIFFDMRFVHELHQIPTGARR